MRSFFSGVWADIRAIRDIDPAARSPWEVMLYPGLHALTLHRVSHRLWRMGVPFVPRLLSQLGRWLTGIEIHPGARVGDAVFIDHGMGVVIGETAEVGDRVTLYQQVTLGGTGKQGGKRHPTLGSDVVVGVGASVLGAITVGTGARVGAGAVLLHDLPPYSTATGIPARIVQTRDPVTGTLRRLERLPDPEGVMLQALNTKVHELEDRIGQLEAELAAHAALHPVRSTPLDDQLFAPLMPEYEI